MPKKDASKLEKHVFRVYDTNNDGVIDFVEFMVVFHILSGGVYKLFRRITDHLDCRLDLPSAEGSPEDVLEKLFRVFDVNSDGNISAKEMERLVADLYGLVKHTDPTRSHTASDE